MVLGGSFLLPCGSAGMKVKLSPLFAMMAFLSGGACVSSNMGLAGDTTPGGDAAMLSWSAFECSEYARIAGNQEEQERLFQLGYKTGTRFLEATRRGVIAQEELKTEVPIAFLMDAAGPTVDFGLGRVFEVAATHVFDRIVKQDRHGMPLPVGQWQIDKEVQKALAEAEYGNRNCALLKLE